MKEFEDVYYFHVMDVIKRGQVVCCTDRQKGDNFYCNGMIVTDLIQLISDAGEDKTNRYQFYTYTIKEVEEGEKDA